MRLIRNTFAHSRLPISFDTPGIVAACAELTLPRRLGKTEALTSREAFFTLCVEYAINLVVYGHKIPAPPWLSE